MGNVLALIVSCYACESFSGEKTCVIFCTSSLGKLIQEIGNRIKAKITAFIDG
jgi:hypothetical protein